ncbi:polysaccharide deacetylase family protein [Deminuibacter soli]|uniref:NodB homology domain-containing protein n=1 Tax=Deminuibacter soli TaxID=2291815 RepID=A0A3E1NK62_9BACT|nr:polysaccharide deacetylase family protein [Deminuibacter soli]RFM28168.1 hypothetical protein DXN05_11645 [Deminuibacter soli]
MRTTLRTTPFLLRLSGGSLAVMLLLAGCKGKSENKAASADSTKNVAAKPTPGGPFKYDSSKRYIFLTWDDSPQPPGSTICKGIFTKEGVKATFFAVGMHMIDQRRKRFVDSIRNGYPEFLLANHSYSHGFQNNYKKYYTQPDSAVQDLLRAESELQVPVKIIRLPGSNSWVGKDENKGPKSAKAVRDKLAAMHYNVIGWDVEWEFKPGGSIPKQGAEELAREINKKFDDGITNEENAIVILSHDRLFAKAQYADSLTRFIQILKQDPRNVFETIDHYPLVQRK